MNATADNSTRYRVSSRFILPKLAIAFALFILIYNLGSDIYNQAFTQETAANLLGTLVLFILFFFLMKVKTIYYDNKKFRLYIFSYKGQFEDETPVEKIDKILFSAVGLGRGFYSYILVYRDVHEQVKKVRLFPIVFSNDIDTIIQDTKLRNPNVVTRSWSIGINEFFD